ncbi:MAG: hypothetical protein KDA42_11260 [Planctomycetales bacterium]|nr:hypothetical protein [Planctomycetales bacterium]
MNRWNLLIDEQALAAVLPAEYGRFARPVSEALAVFLNGLPEPRQAEILAAQGTLPPTASFAQRLALLARSCPVLQKLAQVLARDSRLASDLREQLQTLESLTPAVPMNAIRESLAREFGSLDRLGVVLDPSAIAEASVAVVIGFRSAKSASYDEGVFKILKPDIEERLDQELQLTELVGAHLDQRCEELGIPHLDYQESFSQVREKLMGEIRLDLEQEHLDQAKAFYADEPRVEIPERLDFCTPRVTAMQRIHGCKVTDHRLPLRSEQRRLVQLLIEALVARPIFATESRALFHADPHAGNLFLTDTGRLALLDWSLVGALDDHQRAAIVQVMLGAITLHTERIVDVLTELAETPPDAGALRTTVDGSLRRIRLGQFPGIAWLIRLLDDAVQFARLRVNSDMMMFRKSLHTIDGVLHDLDAGGWRVDSVMMEGFLRNLAAEWPRRWMALPNSRDFATRLSNFDLTRCVLEAPGTAARYWVDQLRDLLSATRTPQQTN